MPYQIYMMHTYRLLTAQQIRRAECRIGTLPFNYTFWHYSMPRLMQNIDRNTQKQGYEFLSHKNQ